MSKVIDSRGVPVHWWADWRIDDEIDAHDADLDRAWSGFIFDMVPMSQIFDSLDGKRQRAPTPAEELASEFASRSDPTIVAEFFAKMAWDTFSSEYNDSFESWAKWMREDFAEYLKDGR